MPASTKSNLSAYSFYILTIFVIFFSSFLLSGCLSSAENQTAIRNTDQNRKERNESDFIPVDIAFFYRIDPDQSQLGNDQLYSIQYKIEFIISNIQGPFKAAYSLTDELGNPVILNRQLSVAKSFTHHNEYILNDAFIDRLCYTQLNYKLILIDKDEEQTYEGHYQDPFLPHITSLKIGPVITRYINNRNNVSLSLSINMTPTDQIKWIHLIPPAMDAFWNIPFDLKETEISANSVIYEKNQNYLWNGTYTLQINLDRLGIIQQEIELIDFLGNKIGLNYGLSVAGILDEDKNYIKLDLNYLDKLDYMEIWVYEKDELDKQKKLGIARITPPTDLITKKNLRTMVNDDFDHPVELHLNTEYIYRIYLYSKEYYGLTYISISDPAVFKIPGILFLPF